MKVAHEKLTYMLNNDFQPMLVNFRCANLGGGGGGGEKAAYIMKSGGGGKSSIYYEIWGGGRKQHIL